jgi:hypothetical protein
MTRFDRTAARQAVRRELGIADNEIVIAARGTCRRDEGHASLLAAMAERRLRRC